MADQLGSLRDDHVPHGLELLLFGERWNLLHLVLVGAENVCADVEPQAVGFRHILIPRQLIYDLIDDGLDRRLQIPILHLALMSRQPFDELLRQFFNALIFEDSVCHTVDELLIESPCDFLERITLPGVCGIQFLKLFREYASGQRKLDLRDTLLGEKAL